MPICGITVTPVTASVSAQSSLDIPVCKLTERVRCRHNLAKREVGFCHHARGVVEKCVSNRIGRRAGNSASGFWLEEVIG